MTVNGIACAFIGRLGGEPELKTSQAGKPWTAISVGDRDEAQWVRVVAFGDKAEQIAGPFSQG